MTPTSTLRRAPLWAAAALCSLTVASAGDASAVAAVKAKPAVSAYVFSWRQSGGTLLVAYLAHAARPRIALCTLHAKPTVKLPKPYFWSFSPQRLAVSGPRPRAKFIGTFAVPVPADKVQKVWVTCH